jgi:hypothetical protein
VRVVHELAAVAPAVAVGQEERGAGCRRAKLRGHERLHAAGVERAALAHGGRLANLLRRHDDVGGAGHVELEDRPVLVGPIALNLSQEW